MILGKRYLIRRMLWRQQVWKTSRKMGMPPTSTRGSKILGHILAIPFYIAILLMYALIILFWVAVIAFVLTIGIVLI